MKQPVYSGEPFPIETTVYNYLLLADTDSPYEVIRQGRKRRVYKRVKTNVVPKEVIGSAVQFMFLPAETMPERFFTPLPPFYVYRKLEHSGDRRDYAKWKEEKGYE